MAEGIRTDGKRLPTARLTRTAGAIAAAAGGVIVVSNLITLVRQLMAHHVGAGALGEDFEPIWAAARSGDAGLYAAALKEFADHPGDPVRLAPFSYPPLVALIVKPLAAVPFDVADAIWLLTGIAALVASGLLLKDAVASWERRSTALLFAALQPAVWWNLEQGNVNLLVLPLSLAGPALLMSGAEIAGGTALGLAAALKGYPALLMLIAVRERRWRLLGAAVASAVLATLAGFLFAGQHSDLYVSAVLPAQLAGSPAADNYGFPGVAARLLTANVYQTQLVDLPLLAWAAPKVALVALVGVTLLAAPGDRSRPFFLTVGLLATLPLVVTTGWHTTLLFTVPALTLVLSRLLEPQPRGLKIVALTALVLVSTSPLLRLAHYSAATEALAIRNHDWAFTLWSLDMTAGCFLAWLSYVALFGDLRGLALRARGGAAHGRTSKGISFEPPAESTR